ncbi:MAG TPA: MmcQ/YjbR family DNA-binding protein [Thermoanaerobaculia bacterium]|jgi:predicted DNA-binding protein (MmcQ/YjbR family)|nr:MmcQ/YjbR family DNA-binding protein [Thermoanaerobaculia bacterium]
MTKAVDTLIKKLRDLALSYPETYEDHPWGETAIKIRPHGKVFLFIGRNHGDVSFGVKLSNSRDMAVDLPWAEPTHYGMGKHGWVTGHLEAKNIPFDLIRAWVDESFRAVAPKKLVKQLDAKA